MSCLKSTTAALILLLLIAGAVVSGALEVQSGRVRLVLHEGSGRYSLYVLAPDESGKYIPLFVDRDPRTSWLAVVVGGRIFKLGEGGEFRETAERTPGGARFEWQSKTLRINQEFTFVTSIDAVSAGAVRIELTLTNLGAAPVSVGVRDCLDTYLGENQQAHFAMHPGGDVTAEATVTREKMIRSWVSAGKQAQGVALQRITSGAGITSPDRIVFANWKRLNEVSWTYDTSIGRSFNLLPYSINDSAVCQNYEPLTLPPGATRRIISILGNYSAAGYDNGVDSAGPPGALSIPDKGGEAVVPSGETQAGAGSAQPTAESFNESINRLRSTVQGLNDLLLKIDRLLSSGQPLTKEEIQLIEQALSDIQSRSAPYIEDR
jgi:hypothetical protein